MAVEKGNVRFFSPQSLKITRIAIFFNDTQWQTEWLYLKHHLIILIVSYSWLYYFHSLRYKDWVENTDAWRKGQWFIIRITFNTALADFLLFTHFPTLIPSIFTVFSFYVCMLIGNIRFFPGILVVKNPPADTGTQKWSGFDPWVWKIP